MSTGGTAMIEGVEVSTDHWIGGNRVGSAGTFTDVSPIDEAADRGGREGRDA